MRQRFGGGDQDAERERKLDRDQEREPGFARARRVPGYRFLRNSRLADIAAGLYDENRADAGVLQPPVKVDGAA